MRLWVKLGLFFSSYLPLFLILAIRNWYNFYAIGILVFATVYSFVWILLFFAANKGTAEKYKLLKIENKTQESLNYLVPYIISFIGFDLTNWQDLGSLFIMLLILAKIYLNSNLLYINPILLFFNYKIYQAKISSVSSQYNNSVSEILLITKENIKVNNDLILKDVDTDNDVFLGSLE